MLARFGSITAITSDDGMIFVKSRSNARGRKGTGKGSIPLRRQQLVLFSLGIKPKTEGSQPSQSWVQSCGTKQDARFKC